MIFYVLMLFMELIFDILGLVLQLIRGIVIGDGFDE